MKKRSWFLLVFCLCFLSGCDYREIDRGYLVSAIGVSHENGVARIYVEAISSSDFHNDETERIVLTASGENLSAAFDEIKKSLTKDLYFEQLGTVVFENDITPEQLSFLQNLPDVNYDIYLVKTDNIKALFSAKTPSGVLGYDVIGILKTNQLIN